MSYILDALRKADAERERGQVPDLHAQTILRGAPPAAQRSGVRPWIWGAALAAVVATSALAWALLVRNAPRDAAGPAATTAPAPPGLTAPPAPAPATTTPAPAATAALPPAAAAPPVVATSPLAASAGTTLAAPRPAAVERPQPEPRVVSKKPASTAAAIPAAAAPKPASAADANLTARASEPRIYAPAELPDDVRRELPALAVGGAMYSENAANRMLIINGQVFHEHDKLSPSLTLVQIKLKSAVLDYKGYRYSISY